MTKLCLIGRIVKRLWNVAREKILDVQSLVSYYENFIRATSVIFFLTNNYYRVTFALLGKRILVIWG